MTVSRMLSPLALVALASCNGGGDVTCPVGQVFIDEVCCEDADLDGTCDPIDCEPPLVNVNDLCECPVGTTADGVDDCCPDVDGNGECDPVYKEPVWIGALALFGWDATNQQIRDYALVSNGTAGTQNPALVLYLKEGSATALGDDICQIYIEADVATNGPLTNVTTFGDDTVGIGMVLDTATATVADGGAVGLDSCTGLLDPAVWGADFPAAIAAAGKDIGFVVTGALNGGDVYTALSPQIPDFSTDWDPYFMEGTTYYEDTGLTAGLFSQGGNPTFVGFGRSAVVDGNFDVGDINAMTYIPKADALITDGAFTMQTAYMPFSAAEAPILVGTL